MSRRPKAPEGATDSQNERVQKLLARAGVASRRGAEDLIRAGRVTINGEVATLGQRASPDDFLKLDGRRVGPAAEKRYLLLNKPTATVTTVSDPEGRKTVLDLVPASLRRGMFPVGRLDYHTEGLLILTNDGDFAQRIGHPKHGCNKLYQVKVRGVPDSTAILKLERGVVLDGRRTKPCHIAPVELGRRHRTETTNSWWQVELWEGRTRQIRDMFQRVGHPVQRLRRTAIGGLRDPSLRPGEFRELRVAEIQALASGEWRPAKPARSTQRARPTRLKPSTAKRKPSTAKPKPKPKPATPKRLGRSKKKTAKPSGRRPPRR